MTEQNKKQKSSPSLILVVGGFTVVFAVGYYVYTTYFQSSAVSQTTQESTTQFPLKKVDWQKDLFASEVFKSLVTRVPLRVGVDAGDVGNDSPFITSR
ncbi:hypothetical protein HY621_03110 [Candidatus Uhrbacteria bacterium]|nr:hypothetical protein [Candidatus Uhrbacteria bacterium]